MMMSIYCTAKLIAVPEKLLEAVGVTELPENELDEEAV